MAIPRENKAINEWIGEWKEWFSPDMTEWDGFQDWGYYSLPFVGKDGKPLGKANTKIVQLNNNICYEFNWESVTVFRDPGNMLQWFEKTLLEIEANNATAIIMSHVPNLEECNP